MFIFITSCCVFCNPSTVSYILGGFGGGVHDSCLSSVSSCCFGKSGSPDLTESLSDPTMNFDRSKIPLKQKDSKILQLF